MQSKIRLTETVLHRIVQDSINQVLKEEYEEYYRRYNKLRGISKNQGQLDAQKQSLTNNYKAAVTDYQNPNYDGGFDASNRLMQHQFKQSSVNNYNRSTQNFEKMKNWFNPQNFKIQIPQPYINAYNQWLQLENQYLKTSQIYYNEYSRVNGRLNMVANTKRLNGEFEKLNNFYEQKVKPLQQQVMQYIQFLSYWSKYFYQMSN
jgi:hypothetical protein